MSPDELRTAQIQRQHSQEMAIRYAAHVGKKPTASDAKDGLYKDHLNWLKLVIDWFEVDIKNAVAIRESQVSTEVQPNGNEKVIPTELVLSLDAAMALKEKIEGAPETMHPMIKVKMGSMGVKGAKDLLSALGQLTPMQAEQLEDYIDAQFDAS